MTFDQMMQKHQGYWEGDTAFIRESGYVWRIAERHGAEVELTFDGKRYVSVETPAPAVDPVEPMRKRKGKVADKPVAPAAADDFNLDDIDFAE